MFITFTAALLACINSNNSKACSIVSLLAFRLASVLCFPCPLSDVWAVGTAGGNEVRSGNKVGPGWKGCSGVEGEGLFWGQRLEMFLESGEKMFWELGEEMFWELGEELFWGEKMFWVVLSMPSGAFVSLGSQVGTASLGSVK